MESTAVEKAKTTAKTHLGRRRRKWRRHSYADRERQWESYGDRERQWERHSYGDHKHNGKGRAIGDKDNGKPKGLWRGRRLV